MWLRGREEAVAGMWVVGHLCEILLRKREMTGQLREKKLGGWIPCG